jgi:hypothetical protein
MLTKEKQEKFYAIAKELYTKEYLGIDGHGLDKEYDEELTQASAAYLISIFKNPSESRGAKEHLLEVMGKKTPQHPSNILKLIL